MLTSRYNKHPPNLSDFMSFLQVIVSSVDLLQVVTQRSELLPCVNYAM